jgi:hypothetical protein
MFSRRTILAGIATATAYTSLAWPQPAAVPNTIESDQHTADHGDRLFVFAY